MSADIEFLNNILPSSEAVLHDALNRSSSTDKVVVCWMDSNEDLHWSTNTTNRDCLWMLEKMKANVL